MLSKQSRAEFFIMNMKIKEAQARVALNDNINRQWGNNTSNDKSWMMTPSASCTLGVVKDFLKNQIHHVDWFVSSLFVLEGKLIRWTKAI